MDASLVVERGREWRDRHDWPSHRGIIPVYRRLQSPDASKRRKERGSHDTHIQQPLTRHRLGHRHSSDGHAQHIPAFSAAQTFHEAILAVVAGLWHADFAKRVVRAGRVRATIRHVPQLLIVHHTPSPTVQAMFEAVLAGATDDQIENVTVVRRPALAATAVDVLNADAVILGTPANIGYMSGALKHFFDQVYYPCLDATKKLPYAVYIHGNNDTAGALRAIESIAGGMGWERVSQPVTVIGEASKADLEACWELGATVAAGLME